MVLITSGFMLMFWSIYDGMISYLTPIIMESKGLSNTQIGLLISFSAICGAAFDLIISKYFRFSHYLRYFIFVFIICLSYPLFLWSTNNFFGFLLIMALWGLTYDFINFGIYDLIARVSPKNKRTYDISVIGTFKSLGYLIGPLLIAYLISSWSLSLSSISFVYLFLSISLTLYVVLFSLSSSAEFFQPEPNSTKSIHWGAELKLWKKFGRVLWPVLIFNTTFFIFEATFWTLGPIFSQQFPDVKNFSFLFMGVYIFPSLFVIKFAQMITNRFGKKRTAYVSLIISSIFLLPFAIISNPIILLLMVFFSTIFATLAWSAIGGAFVDYVAESDINDNEIIGLKDFSANIGYVIGPTLAGILSDQFGIRGTFTILSIICILIVSSLFSITPKHIDVSVR